MSEISKYSKEANRWFEQALEDLISAKILLSCLFYISTNC